MRSWRIGIGIVLVPLLLQGLAGATESGPEGRPQLVHDFFPGEFERDDSPRQLTQLGNVLFFVAGDVDTPSRVWRTDGTPAGTRQVQAPGAPGTAGDFQDLWPGPRGSDPQILYVSDGALWLAATEPSAGREIWKTDL